MTITTNRHKIFLAVRVLIAGLATLTAVLFELEATTTSLLRDPSLISPEDVDDGPHRRSLIKRDTSDELIKLAERFNQSQTFAINRDTLMPRQFFHIHNMKTAGTSMDRMMKCAMQRMRDDTGLEVPYYILHECHRSEYKKCRAGEDHACMDRMNNSAIVSLCGPLHDLVNIFGWNDSRTYQSVTIFRHPVDRVWSMYRFSTRLCFQCKNLTTIYKEIDSGNIDPRIDDLCVRHLQNKQTENLLMGTWMNKIASEEEKVAEALYNMKHAFTMIGLTEQMTLTHKMLGQVFPWLNETISGSPKSCPMTHANPSPNNNLCGPGLTHWNLPAHPDEETRHAIISHNQMDLKLYEAALEYFELQKQVLGIVKDSVDVK